LLRPRGARHLGHFRARAWPDSCNDQQAGNRCPGKIAIPKQNLENGRDAWSNGRMCPETAAQTTRPVRRIRTLVADDEPLARELLGNFVRRDPGLEWVGEAASGAETLTAVRQYAPELLLLDIQMPSLDGISVAEQLAGMAAAPYIIFVTAHDNFALQAFEVAVRDYLVKPVSKRRFATAIRRARQALSGTSIETGTAATLTVRNGDELTSLEPDDIVWVEAANQYVRLHTGNREFVVSQSLRQFARDLPRRQFARIHRSTLINLRHIVGVRTNDGRYRVEMSDDSLLDIARSRKSLVPDLLAQARRNAAA